ncbi:hypothetical protein CAOG_06487 [Capsaspora owczarzaki ATCC 30864]|uniref:hypothetical protein n=1 Tax=Capsaspora owczarzaki (strain ATCC 30864) TaxID=595528 RepID=UPI0001FE37FE|nr:hypothetical protein CAOG_06487 [Capsaspora owczarzaki ATCC 30864]|eukprot:XP_004345236.1 hypothetical protein CAOG_06487 [Capsaspora owczarzaki ATCC 30864]
MEAPIGIFKIYVYKRILNAMPTRDECRDSLQIMWYEEIELPYWIRDSIHHTDNPEEAHFFYIPTMVKCLFNLNRARFNETRQFLISVRHLHRSPYFHRNNGHDHALLNPGGGSYNVTSSVLHGSYLFGRGAGHYSNVTKLLTEAYRPYAYFAGRDIIVPGYPDDAFFSYQETYQDALRERRRLFLYTGGVQLSYQRRQLGRLAELLKIPSAKSSFYAPLVLLQTRKVSSNKFEYQQLVKDFTFCAAPRGTSPWTQRFYDAAIVGCIPVLFDRNFVLPFPNQIDWDSIVVRFSEDFSHSFSFLDHLYQLSQDVEAIRERRRKLADVTSILYYGLAVNATQPAAVTPEAFSDPDPVVRREAYKYSPYSMIVRELSDRSQEGS